MKGFAKDIEIALDTAIEGLSYEILTERFVIDLSQENFKNYIGYELHGVTKGGEESVKGALKFSGHIREANEHSLVYETLGKNSTRRTLMYTKIGECKVTPTEGNFLSDDKMLQGIKSKVKSFSQVKDLINQWSKIGKGGPGKDKLKNYAVRLKKAGDKSLTFLRKCLTHKIDYDELEPTKHAKAIEAKTILVDEIYALDKALVDLDEQIKRDDYDFEAREFELGYAEKFANGLFYPEKNYHKNVYDQEKDAIRICPKGTEGEMIVIDGLKIVLPKVPYDKKKILFHNRKKEDQYWDRKRLLPHGQIHSKNQNLFHDYIMEDYKRRREGVWFYNNGEPTYLTGNAYYCLMWGRMWDDGGYMEFRVSQLKMDYHIEACFLDDRCLGQIFLKARRTGFTYWAIFRMLNVSTRTKNALFGMTSKTEKDVKEVWMKFTYAFRHLPVFARPVVQGDVNSTSSLYFGKPLDKSKDAKKEGNFDSSEYLNTKINWQSTRNGAYDSTKLKMYLGDEAGKWLKPNDYVIHLSKIRPTMMPSGNVVGKALIGSTMGIYKEGGEQFVELIRGSNPLKRDKITSKTATGLYFHFMPAQENMPIFTDKYGKCWEKAPPPGLKNVLGENMHKKYKGVGSIEYLISEEKKAESISAAALNGQYRTYPRTVELAMLNEASQCQFNMHKIQQQIAYNKTQDKGTLYMVGNFEWVDLIDGDVKFVQNVDGRFKVSWLPTMVNGCGHLANNVIKRGNKYFPGNKEFVYFGCDPYAISQTRGTGSKGALHGVTGDMPIGGAPANKFVVEYVYRPEKEKIFFEDVIKCIRYYGAPILVESNRMDLLKYMKSRGYRGFSMNRIDKASTEAEKEHGGQTMSGENIIMAHLNAVGNYILNYVGVYTDSELQMRPIGQIGDMPFIDTLDDWLTFDPKNRGKYDAFISSGMALMAANADKYRGKMLKKEEKIKITKFVNRYDTSGNLIRSRPREI